MDRTHIYNIRNLKLSYPLLHLLLHRLVRTQERLLVDHNLCRVRPWSADARRDGRRVCLYDDPRNGADGRQYIGMLHMILQDVCAKPPQNLAQHNIEDGIGL